MATSPQGPGAHQSRKIQPVSLPSCDRAKIRAASLPSCGARRGQGTGEVPLWAHAHTHTHTQGLLQRRRGSRSRSPSHPTREIGLQTVERLERLVGVGAGVGRQRGRAPAAAGSRLPPSAQRSCCGAGRQQPDTAAVATAGAGANTRPVAFSLGGSQAASHLQHFQRERSVKLACVYSGAFETWFY